MDPQSSRPAIGQRLRTRPLLTAGIAAAVLAGIAIVLVWFQPQALLFDDVVDEEFPTVGPSAAADADGAAGTVDDGGEADGAAGGSVAESQAPAGPVALATGGFDSRSRYTVTGEVTVFELPDRSRTLRLEDFESTNGPDLYVYLTAADSADGDVALDEDFIDLGLLTGNVGDQNYTIPDGVDLELYDTVVIWCRRFTVGFGAADLVPA
jgi:hypothetical protein